ncbi:MAG TPA: hypothetical protein VLA39_08940 [Marinobacterium sp.]|nr:hypothetical protein [Marinobacterium sp.]
MNEITVTLTSNGKLVCAERDKVLVFPQGNETTESFLRRATEQLKASARNYQPEF